MKTSFLAPVRVGPLLECTAPWSSRAAPRVAFAEAEVVDDGGRRWPGPARPICSPSGTERRRAARAAPALSRSVRLPESWGGPRAGGDGRFGGSSTPGHRTAEEDRGPRSKRQRARDWEGSVLRAPRPLQLVIDYVKQETLTPLQGPGSLHRLRRGRLGGPGHRTGHPGRGLSPVPARRRPAATFAGNCPGLPYLICTVVVVRWRRGRRGGQPGPAPTYPRHPTRRPHERRTRTGSPATTSRPSSAS